MKKTLLTFLTMMLCAITSQAASVTIKETGGWFESAYVTWDKTAGVEYNVYISPYSSDSWTKLDDELVREYPDYGRADALGLKAGNYKFKVVPVSNGTEVTADAAVTTDAVTVKAHDRSGFAHKQAGDTGIGAYKNDGTLKDNARVVYVWADNAKTVSLSIAKNSNGEEEIYTGLQQIIYGYQKGDNNGSYEKRPLCIRIIGTIKAADVDEFLSKAEGIQIKGAKAYQKMNITIEGVGNDATIWGFGFLLRNTALVELRNFGIMWFMDDAVSIDTDNEMLWVHNLDIFYGQPGSDSDQKKGDGTIDMKGDSRYLTVSYNHLFDSGKASLCGMKSESGPNWITYHHNWFDHSDSRHPRIRTMSVHVYNNYYDGNSKYGVGAAYQSEAFVENNYFRNCKYPMLISMQGSDLIGGKGTFSSEDGGMIKSFGNYVTGASALVTYQQNNTEFDCWEATTRNETVPSTVKAKQGGKTYSNFDTDNSIMYSYTPDDASDVPTIVKGQYGAGRVQHGDFKWTFDNSVQDKNYEVISELSSAIGNYSSTLIGFFDGDHISNGGADKTVNGGDSSSGDEYTPDWGGGSSSGGATVEKPDPNFCGSKKSNNTYDYLWFNADNSTTINGLINGNGGLLTLSDESSFNATRELKNEDGTIASKYTGSVQLPKSNGSITFKCVNGVSSISVAIFRTGSAKGEIQISTDGTSFTKLSEYSATKGDQTINVSTTEYTTGPVWVRITNAATGSLHITGIKIMYPDSDGATVGEDDYEDAGDDTSLSDDTAADFIVNDESISFTDYMATVALAYDDARTTISVKVELSDENAKISDCTGAEGTSVSGTYTITVPTAGNATRATFTITAEDGSKQTYIIKVEREADPADIEVETGTINLQSDNVPEGYKVDGSSTVTAYTYSSDLCNDALLFKASASQHTVTLPTGAKVTKIVMYAVGDNNTANKGEITELAGQVFAVDLPSRKTGTAFATATVEDVAITGSFTYTVTYAAGVKFELTVVENGSGEQGNEPSVVKNEVAYIATTGTTDFDYYWFNKENEDEVNAWISDGTITLTNGTGEGDSQSKSSFKPTTKPGSDKNGWSDKIGTLEIAKAAEKGATDGGTVTFYCPYGAKEFKLYMFRTGTYNFHVYKSTDNQQWTDIGSDTSSSKGKLEVSYKSDLDTTDPVYVKIENTSTGGLNIQGIIITYEKSVNVVKTAASGWTSLVSGKALDFTGSGLKAYIATSVDNGAKEVTLQEVSAVPANTPVLLKGETGTEYTISIVDAVDRLTATNLLQGSATQSTYLAEASAFILTGGKFYLNQAGTMPAGKAYLPASIASGAHELTIAIGGDATAIKNIKVGTEDNVYYDLQGRRVLYPTKGLYIVNGKKVLVK